MPSKRYKDYRFYAFVVLNFITSTLDIHIFQKGLEGIITPILENQDGVSKSSIMYEINSNHNMTNKVLDYLVEEKNLKRVADELMNKFGLSRNMISIKKNWLTKEDQIEISGYGPYKPIEKFIKEKYSELEVSGYKKGKMFAAFIK